MKKVLALLLVLALLCGIGVCAETLVEDGVALNEEILVEYGNAYLSMEEVSLYLYAFGDLPVNYLTKNEAYDLGWVSSEGNLWDIEEGLCIGGDKFGNREGLLLDAEGRRWFEADVNFAGGYRGAERLLFSNDGLIYYSGDHYTTATLLYDSWYEAGYTYGAGYENAMEWRDAA